MFRCLLTVMLGIAAARGAIVFEGPIRSEILQTNRYVRVYLPPGYLEETTARYPVLYVHDGQNAFTTAGPHAAFGWGNWELDQTASRLIDERKIRPIILVAVDCSAARYREYRGLIPAALDNSAFERYARFLIEELKPRIDREYRTLSAAAHTGTMGSSMGGICSLALAWKHPGVFGLAASLSGSFQIEKSHFLGQLRAHTAGPKPFRAYLDSGTADFSGGDDGAQLTAAVAGELERIGWRKGADLEHFVDPLLKAGDLQPFNLPPDKFNEAQRSQHNELYWRLRAWRPLSFLFPPAEK